MIKIKTNKVSGKVKIIFVLLLILLLAVILHINHCIDQKKDEKKYSNCAFYNAIGSYFFEEGKLDKAQDQFEKALKIDAVSAEGYNNLASVFAEKKENDKAVYFYKKALLIDHELIDTYINLGVIYARMGKFADAKNIWDLGLEISPGDETIKNYLFLLEKKGTRIFKR